MLAWYRQYPLNVLYPSSQFTGKKIKIKKGNLRISTPKMPGIKTLPLKSPIPTYGEDTICLGMDLETLEDIT